MPDFHIGRLVPCDEAELRSIWVPQLKRGHHASGAEEAEPETLFKFFNKTRLRCFTP